jgi:hypothetical protein
MRNNGKNPIRKHVFGKRYLVFEADALAAHVAVRYFPQTLWGYTDQQPSSVPSRTGLWERSKLFDGLRLVVLL